MASGTVRIVMPPPELVIRESDGKLCVLASAHTPSGKLIGVWVRVPSEEEAEES